MINEQFDDCIKIKIIFHSQIAKILFKGECCFIFLKDIKVNRVDINITKQYCVHMLHFKMKYVKVFKFITF